MSSGWRSLTGLTLSNNNSACPSGTCGQNTQTNYLPQLSVPIAAPSPSPSCHKCAQKQAPCEECETRKTMRRPQCPPAGCANIPCTTDVGCIQIIVGCCPGADFRTLNEAICAAHSQTGGKVAILLQPSQRHHPVDESTFLLAEGSSVSVTISSIGYRSSGITGCFVSYGNTTIQNVRLSDFRFHSRLPSDPRAKCDADAIVESSIEGRRLSIVSEGVGMVIRDNNYNIGLVNPDEPVHQHICGSDLVSGNTGIITICAPSKCDASTLFVINHSNATYLNNEFSYINEQSTAIHIFLLRENVCHTSKSNIHHMVSGKAFLYSGAVHADCPDMGDVNPCKVKRGHDSVPVGVTARLESSYNVVTQNCSRGAELTHNLGITESIHRFDNLRLHQHTAPHLAIPQGANAEISMHNTFVENFLPIPLFDISYAGNAFMLMQHVSTSLYSPQSAAAVPFILQTALANPTTVVVHHILQSMLFMTDSASGIMNANIRPAIHSNIVQYVLVQQEESTARVGVASASLPPGVVGTAGLHNGV